MSRKNTYAIACTIRAWIKSPTPTTFPEIGALPADNRALVIGRFIRATHDFKSKQN